MAAPEEIKQASREGKEQEIRDKLGIVVPDTMDDEKIDIIYGIAHMTLDEKIDNIMECMETLNVPENDLEEALRVHTGLKLSEAKIVIDDKIEERNRPKTKVDRILEII